MSLNRRLDKLEDNLTPTEAVIRWIREVREFESFLAYFAWLAHQPAELWPFERLLDQVARGAKSRAKGAHAEQVAARVRQAERDVVLLLVIHQIANLEVARELALQTTRTQHTFDLLRELIQLDCGYNGLRRDRRTLQCSQFLAAEMEMDERYLRLATRCRHDIARALFRVQTLSLVVERLSSTYLRRHSLLFPDLRAGLTILRQTLSAQLTFFADHERRREQEPEADAVRNLVREALAEKQVTPKAKERSPEAGPEELALNEAAVAWAHSMALQARAEAFHLLGDASACASLLAQHLEEAPSRGLTEASRAAPKAGVKKKSGAPSGRTVKTTPAASGSAKTGTSSQTVSGR